MLPLHFAIEHMDEDRVVELLASGADPNEGDPYFAGMCPLRLSVDIECEEARWHADTGGEAVSPRASLTKLLLAAGADPDLPDASGQTARELARERRHADALSLFEVWQK